MKDKTMKIVVVGDGFCGKTSLIVAYTSGSFNERYVPTAFDDFSVEVTVNGETHVVTVADTAGEDEFSAMRPLSYPDADVFLFCYAVDKPDSLKDIENKWIPEVRRFCPHSLFIVVGTKSDLRLEEPEEPLPLVSLDEAKELAHKQSCFPIIESSAKSKDNVNEVFEAAVKAAIAYRNRGASRVLQSITKFKFVF